MAEKMCIEVLDKLTYYCVKLRQEITFEMKDDEIIEKIGIAKGLIDNTTGEKPNFISKYKFFMVVTMYNEEPLLFNKTMSAINKNIEAFLEDGSLIADDIAVCVVVDGIKPFNEGIEKLKSSNDLNKDYYDSIFSLDKIYEYHEIKDSKDKFKQLLDKKLKIQKDNSIESLRNSQRNNLSNRKATIKNAVKDRYYEFAHVFHCKAKFDANSPCHVNLLFTVKQQNKRKLNSHLWYFGGFCFESNPDYCMLIDVGTEPEPRALYLLYRALDKDAQIAGVCGEIVPKGDDDSVFDLLCYAQKVEYKFSHILDKALESIIGYITVLPGAFSAYRYSALEPENLKGPLWGDYFFSILNPKSLSCYKANIYLAEDRVLCLSLVAAEGKNNLLKYVRRAVAYTDPPPDFEQLTNQRRRWINGSWFALLDSVKNCKKLLSSSHNPLRKCIFMLQMFYYILNIMYSFILVGGFWLALSICIRRLFGNSGNEDVVKDSSMNTAMSGLLIGYVALLLSILIISLGSKIKDANFAMKTISVFLSCYMALFIVLLVNIFFNSWGKIEVMAPVLLTVIGFFLILVVNDAVLGALTGSIQFLLATPIYINIFTIYAICNIHDVSWGNRAQELTQEEKEQMDENEKFRTGWTLLWAFINFFFAYILDAADQSDEDYAMYIYVIGFIGMCMIYIRFIGGFANFLKQKFFKYTCIEKGRNLNDSSSRIRVK